MKKMLYNTRLFLSGVIYRLSNRKIVTPLAKEFTLELKNSKRKRIEKIQEELDLCHRLTRGWDSSNYAHKTYANEEQRKELIRQLRLSNPGTIIV